MLDRHDRAADRDSAGLAVFTERGRRGRAQVQPVLSADARPRLGRLSRTRCTEHLGGEVTLRGHRQPRRNRAARLAGGCVALARRGAPEAARALRRPRRSTCTRTSGTRPTSPERYGFSDLAGTPRRRRTRAWRPSRPSRPAHAHPFTAGEDFCLVHNGSLSNPYSLRRKLEPRGMRLRDRQRHRGGVPLPANGALREGDDLEAALQHGVRGARRLLHVPDRPRDDELALVRDPFACKPAVVAETDDYVAIVVRIPLARPPARRQATPTSSSRSPRRSTSWNK